MMVSSHELFIERNIISNKMIEYFKDKEEVTAIFTLGSLAKGIGDEYSDIDFRVIIYKKHIDDKIFGFLRNFF